MAPDTQHRLRNIRTAAVVVVSLVALLTACGRTYWATVNPCSLLTTAEVATTLGATKLDTIDAHPSSDGKASYCTYQVGGQQTLVVIQLDKQLSTPAVLKTAVAQTNGFTIEPVAGVGDEAFFLGPTTPSDPSLAVYRGDQHLGMAFMHNTQAPATARTAIVLLARKVLSRLPA